MQYQLDIFFMLPERPRLREERDEDGAPNSLICIKFQSSASCSARSGFGAAQTSKEREGGSQIRKCLRDPFWQRRSFATMRLVLYFQFVWKKEDDEVEDVEEDSTSKVKTSPKLQIEEWMSMDEQGTSFRLRLGFSARPLARPHYNSLRIHHRH